MLTIAVVHDVVFAIVGKLLTTHKLNVTIGEIITLVYVLVNSTRDVVVSWRRDRRLWRDLRMR